LKEKSNQLTGHISLTGCTSSEIRGCQVNIFACANEAIVRVGGYKCSFETVVGLCTAQCESCCFVYLHAVHVMIDSCNFELKKEEEEYAIWQHSCSVFSRCFILQLKSCWL